MVEKMLATHQNDKKYMVGFDLGENSCQISYCTAGSTLEPVTFAVTDGTDDYDIPTRMTKKTGVNIWFVGKEAEEWNRQGAGTEVAHILSAAVTGRPINIEGQEYDPCSMLALFIKRCLVLLSTEVPTEKIATLMFTLDSMDAPLVEALKKVRKFLDLPIDDIAWESHSNSYYNFLFMQPRSLHEKDSILFEYDGSRTLYSYRMVYNVKTDPIVAFIKKQEFREMSDEAMKKQQASSQQTTAHDLRDETFLSVLKKCVPVDDISSAFLIGEGFRTRWMKESLSYLCYHRRVFLGNNLYSRGAAYGALMRGDRPQSAREYFFLGDNCLTTNVGVMAMKHDRSMYYPLMSAGTSWYEAGSEKEFIVDGASDLHLILTPITGGETREKTITLEGMPVRPPRTTRIKLCLSMNKDGHIMVHAQDLGFGEMFPATDKIWDKEIEIV